MKIQKIKNNPISKISKENNPPKNFYLLEGGPLETSNHQARNF